MDRVQERFKHNEQSPIDSVAKLDGYALGYDTKLDNRKICGALNVK